jgi:hypothetical protein
LLDPKILAPSGGSVTAASFLKTPKMCSGASLTRTEKIVAARSQESGVAGVWFLVSGGEAFAIRCWMFELPVRLGLKMRMMKKTQVEDQLPATSDQQLSAAFPASQLYCRALESRSGFLPAACPALARVSAP